MAASERRRDEPWLARGKPQGHDMRQLRYNLATSLDGFIASPDGSSDWIVEDSSIDFDALYKEFDLFVMGRKTYEVMMSFASSPLTKLPKGSVIVVSAKLKAVDHPSITVLSENWIEFIRRKKTQRGKDIWLMGGEQLASSCLAAGLIDSIEAAIMPVILGRGINMLGDTAFGGKASYKLELEDAKRKNESGILMTRYRVRYDDHYFSSTSSE